MTAATFDWLDLALWAAGALCLAGVLLLLVSVVADIFRHRRLERMAREQRERDGTKGGGL